ncbi:hypothetical protein ACM66B_003040 [Microbotryomycetes sp. NB124-2]
MAGLAGDAAAEAEPVGQRPKTANVKLVSAIERQLTTTGTLDNIDTLWDEVLNRYPSGQPVDSDAHSQSSGDEAGAQDSKHTRRPGKRGRRRKEDDNLLERDDLDINTKRKLQNRAAQRNFRERKERHLHDLERKVVDQAEQISALLSVCQSLFAENQALQSGRPARPAQATNGNLPSPESASHASPPRDARTMPTSAMTLSASASTSTVPMSTRSPMLDQKPHISSLSPIPPPAPTFDSMAAANATQPSSTHFVPAIASHVEGSSPYAPVNDVSHIDFDFDAPFDIADAVPLPPLFQTFLDQYSASVAESQPSDKPDQRSTREQSQQSEIDSNMMEDACPGIDDEPPPLPNGKVPCPECDFSVVSCALPMPWRPPNIDKSIESKDVWMSQKAWAKLCSHPLFSQCDVDELCTELRDRTRCSDDGRLVISKSDVCDVFRSIPARARLREQQKEMTTASRGL